MSVSLERAARSPSLLHSVGVELLAPCRFARTQSEIIWRSRFVVADRIRFSVSLVGC